MSIAEFVGYLAAAFLVVVAISIAVGAWMDRK